MILWFVSTHCCYLLVFIPTDAIASTLTREDARDLAEGKGVANRSVEILCV